MDNAFRRPPTPGIGRTPRAKRVLVLCVLAVMIAMAAGAFAFFTMWLQRGDTPSELVDFPADINSKIDQEDWLVGQRRDELRTGLVILDQEAELIWDEINELQIEIDAYQKELNELMTSEKGKQLITDEWSVRYFIDRHGEPLPHDKVARHSLVRLNTLMFTVKRALAKTRPTTERGAYELSPTTIGMVKQIAFDVHHDKTEYVRHRNLLHALSARVANGETLTPKTLQEAIQAMQDEMTLKDWQHPSVRQQKDTDAVNQAPDTTGNLDPKDDESKPETALDLLHRMRLNQSGVKEDFNDTTLGRDEVRDRNEPPRRRPSQ